MQERYRFRPEDASAAFNEIAERYYNHNFGQMSKTDFEVLLFRMYQENLHRNHLPADDFSIATDLGITESKVRNMKVKTALQYPDSGVRWQVIFLQSVQYAACDDRKTVRVSIKDPNVKRNLEHMIDELNLYSETQLNPKLLQMRADHFITLCSAISRQLGSEDMSEIELRKQLLDSSAHAVLQEAGIVKRIMAGESIKSMRSDIIAAAGKAGIAVLLKGIPFGADIQKYVDAFIDRL